MKDQELALAFYQLTNAIQFMQAREDSVPFQELPLFESTLEFLRDIRTQIAKELHGPDQHKTLVLEVKESLDTMKCNVIKLHRLLDDELE